MPELMFVRVRVEVEFTVSCANLGQACAAVDARVRESGLLERTPGGKPVDASLRDGRVVQLTAVKR